MVMFCCLFLANVCIGVLPFVANNRETWLHREESQTYDHNLRRWWSGWSGNTSLPISMSMRNVAIRGRFALPCVSISVVLFMHGILLFASLAVAWHIYCESYYRVRNVHPLSGMVNIIIRLTLGTDAHTVYCMSLCRFTPSICLSCIAMTLFFSYCSER